MDKEWPEGIDIKAAPECAGCGAKMINNKHLWIFDPDDYKLYCSSICWKDNWGR
jgi:hypothetical protein